MTMENDFFVNQASYEALNIFDKILRGTYPFISTQEHIRMEQSESQRMKLWWYTGGGNTKTNSMYPFPDRNHNQGRSYRQVKIMIPHQENYWKKRYKPKKISPKNINILDLGEMCGNIVNGDKYGFEVQYIFHPRYMIRSNEILLGIEWFIPFSQKRVFWLTRMIDRLYLFLKWVFKRT